MMILTHLIHLPSHLCCWHRTHTSRVHCTKWYYLDKLKCQLRKDTHQRVCLKVQKLHGRSPTASEPLPRNCEYVIMFTLDFPTASKILLLAVASTFNQLYTTVFKKDQVFIKVSLKLIHCHFSTSWCHKLWIQNQAWVGFCILHIHIGPDMARVVEVLLPVPIFIGSWNFIIKCTY